jgi:hypothetical protein
MIWIFSFLSIALAQNLPAPWQAIRIPGMEQAWTNPQKPGHMIVLTKNKTLSKLNITESSKSEVISGLIAFRQMTLTQFGFSDWKLSEFKISKTKISLRGSYLRPGKVRVHFYENQYYAGNTFEQVSYLIESEKSATSLDEIEVLLNRVSVGERAPAQDDAKTEAAVEEICRDCELPKIEGVQVAQAQITELAKSADQCSKDAWLADPDKKSILKEQGYLRGSDSKIEIAARAFLTCNYGALSGAGKSFRDVVFAIPQLLGLTWQGLKSASNATINFEYRKWLTSFSVQKIKDITGGFLTVTKETVEGAFTNASLAAYNSYKEGGVTGALAAVGQAAYNSAPHAAVGQFLLKIGSEIYKGLSEEWTALGCMEAEALSQAMCEVAGYLAVDLLTGKLLLSGLSKSGKLKDAIAAVRGRMEKVPLAGEFITRNLKMLDSSRCDKASGSDWKIDSGFKLQGQDLTVLKDGAVILARGLSPKTGRLECFEVKGSLAEKVSSRIAATEKRSLSLPALKDPDYFTASNPNYARSTEEFVEGVNKKSGVELSWGQTRKVAQSLEADPAQLEIYGDLNRSLDQLRKQKSQPGLGSDSASSLDKVIRSTEESLRLVNSNLSLLEKPGLLNLKELHILVKQASETGSSEGIQLFNRALLEFGKVAKSSGGDMGKALTLWESSLKAERKHLTSKEIDRAKECLFTLGTK